jgi:NAD(P)-dependent dehydrogenase (short-subunit alcohol dehydrogenase family)
LGTVAKAPSILDRLFALHGKCALVTGGSGGIGRALAVALAEAGAAVAVHGRDEQDLAETRRQIEVAGGRAIVLRAELADVEACRKLVADTVKHLGRLDVLVNCAGANRRRPLAEATADDFDFLMAVNLRSAFLLCQEARSVMKARGGGKIINIGSLTTTWGVGGVGVYGMTKSALGHLTRTLAVEWSRDNIQVNCLAPGFIMTPLTEKGLWGDEGRRKWILDRVPARRPGQPEDLIGTTLLLASSASDFLTGQIITVDGGFLAGGWWEPDDR